MCRKVSSCQSFHAPPNTLPAPEQQHTHTHTHTPTHTHTRHLAVGDISVRNVRDKPEDLGEPRQVVRCQHYLQVSKETYKVSKETYYGA